MCGASGRDGVHLHRTLGGGHGPTSCWRTSSRLRTRITLLTAFRKARAEASTTSVDTPRPDTRTPSDSNCTITSPNASTPLVTEDTLKSVSVPSTPVAALIALQAA